MNKPTYGKVTLWCLVLAVGVWHGWAQPKTVQAKPGQNSPSDVGRNNPFGELPRSKKPTPQRPAQTSEPFEETPNLYLEIVTLKYLDAQTTGAALQCMSSSSGNIAVLEKINSLIIIDTQENLERILAEIAKIDRPTPGLSVETITLKFLDAENLKKALDRMVSQYGSIATNPTSNSLIVCDTKENLAKILSEIKKADRTPQQIMVEVFILDVKLEDDTEIGINWDLLSDTNYDISYRQNFTASRLGSTIESVDTVGNATAFNTTGLGGDFAMISGTIRNVVHMLQQKKEVEILASPTAMVLSGQSATIKAVEEIPYEDISDTSMGGAAAITSTKFKDVGVNLQVTATVTDGNGIFLTVDTEQNVKTSESRNGVPVVDTRRAQTSLLLNDGQIIAMGGLRRRENTKKVDQIPILGDLPIIGALFKSTITVINNSELVVLLSPHIYKGEPIPSEVMSKYNQIKDGSILSIPHERDKQRRDQVGRLNE